MDIETISAVITDGRQTKASMTRLAKIMESWSIAELVYAIKHGNPVPLNESESGRLVRAFDMKIAEHVNDGDAGNPGAIADRCWDMRMLPFEALRVIALDVKNVITFQWDFTGTASGVNVQHAQIYRNPLKWDVERFVLVHNHPSGNLNASHEDYDFTNKMVAGAATLGLSLLDHVIVSKEGYRSLRQEGRVSFTGN